MENVWILAALWVGLALVVTLLAIWFRIPAALIARLHRWTLASEKQSSGAI
jgi:hypothetical protein